MKINHNIAAMRTINELGKVNKKAGDTMLRLSSGLRINRAADDAAGMAISSKMNAQIKGLAQANRNTMDGVSMVQTAEGALNETHAILRRMRELATQASNGTYTEEDREKFQQEINQLTDEITRIAESTEFNTKPLLQGGEEVVILAEESITIETNGTVGETLGELYFKTPITEEDMENLPGQSVIVGDKEFVFIDADSDLVLEDHMVAINLDTIKPNNDGNYAEPFYRVLGNEIEKYVPIDVVRETTPNDTTVANKFVFKTKAGAGRLDGLPIGIGTERQPVDFILQVGANKDQVMGVEIHDMSAKALGLVGMPYEPGFSQVANVAGGAALNFMTQEDSEVALDTIDRAVELVSAQRSRIGAVQNRLEHTMKNLGVSEENLTTAMSRIRDADMAYEMAQYSQQNVISQAATSMLAQANQRPQQVLQLLQN